MLAPRWTPAEAGRWTTLMITAGEGGVDWKGTGSGGIVGTRSTGALAAAAKPAALTAVKAPVIATTPETPPIVHDADSLESLVAVVGSVLRHLSCLRRRRRHHHPPPLQLSSHHGAGDAVAVGLGVAVELGPPAE